MPVNNADVKNMMPKIISVQEYTVPGRRRISKRFCIMGVVQEFAQKLEVEDQLVEITWR